MEIAEYQYNTPNNRTFTSALFACIIIAIMLNVNIYYFPMLSKIERIGKNCALYNTNKAGRTPGFVISSVF